MKSQKEYQVVNGTSYDAQTNKNVIEHLENAYRTQSRIIITYGDVATGESWGDTSMIEGYIGRSTGQNKVPLLIASNRSTGGPALLDSAIIRIRTASGKRLIWKADNFQNPAVEVVNSDMPEYTHNVLFNGEVFSRHKSIKSANSIASILR